MSQRSAARILCGAGYAVVPFFRPSSCEGNGAPGGARGLRGPLGVCETPLADSLRRSLPAHLGRAQRGPPPGMRGPNDVGASASRRSITAGKLAQPAALKNSQACAHGATLDCFGSARMGHMNPRPRAPPRSIRRTSPEDAPQRAKVAAYVFIFLARSRKS